MVDSKIVLDEGRDYLLYFGPIDRNGYNKLSDLLESKSTDFKKCQFTLITNGGSPDSAYRIARALGHYYTEGVTVSVPDYCKSAGTLIVIGASDLIIGDRGELGPLDVQLQNKDEIFEMSSGLDIIQSLTVIQEQAKGAFKDYLLEMRLGAGCGTKLSTQIAAKMAIKLVSPITAQIDPNRLGEHQRALTIAVSYGERLNKKFSNTNIKNINKLLAGYPSHSFVIDRKEANELFDRVSAPDENQIKIDKLSTTLCYSLPEEMRVIDLRHFIEGHKNEAHDKTNKDESKPNRSKKRASKTANNTDDRESTGG